MKGSERKQSRKSAITQGVRDFRETRLHRGRDSEEDEDKLDLVFIPGWLCVGGLAYFAFAILKGFIVQGVM